MLPILASVLGTLGSLVWLSVPSLRPWGLQLAALLLLLYLLSLRLTGKRWNQFLPPKSGLHSVFLTAGAGILVGSTGGTESVFFLFLPLTIFFCTLTLPVSSVITQTVGLTLLLWMVHPAPGGAMDWSRLLLLVILLPVALLARLEMESSRQSQHAEWLATQHREHQAKDAMIFLGTLVGPKIQSIQLFLQQSAENRLPAAKQLETLASEIREFAHELEADKPGVSASPTQESQPENNA